MNQFIIHRIHFGQIVSNHKLAPIIERLRSLSISKTKGLREVAGLNLSALEYFGNQLSSKDEISLFAQAYSDVQEKRKKRNKKHDHKESVYLIGV